MSTPIKIAELERDTDRAFNTGDPNIFWPESVCSALLRLARASDRYAWMLSKDGPGEDEEHVVVEIVAEWVAAREAFDFSIPLDTQRPLE